MVSAFFALFLSAVLELSFPVEKYTLENGLEVILSPDHRLPVVAVNVWYHVGPVNEPPGRTGYAHLFEHLMFQGSAHVENEEHFALLESAGATNINGTTSFDRTNYFETLPSDQVELALWLEADRMGFLLPALSESKLEIQRQTILNERRQTVDRRPYGRSSEAFFNALFGAGHPYHGFLIGTAEDLDAVTLRGVREFYDRFYAPANATLAVVGDFDRDAMTEMIERYFGTLPRRPPPGPRQIITVPIRKEIRLTVEEPVELARIEMGWHSPAVFEEGDAAADLLAVILGRGRSSRLQRLVDRDGLARSVSASQRSLQLKSVFSIAATAPAEVPVSELEAALQEAIDAIRASPPTALEMARARNLLMTEAVFGLEQVGARADQLNRTNHYRGDPSLLRQTVARYERVSTEDVQRLARELLRNDRRVVVTTVPTR